jgi:hypothetical protein
MLKVAPQALQALKREARRSFGEHPASGGRVALPSFNLKNNSTFALDVYI